MAIIQPIGSYLELDERGYIINPASLEKIQEKYLPAVKEIKEEYLKHFGENLHSVYLRGSVAKGEAIENISDIDSFAVIALKDSDINTDWAGEFNNSIRTKYPFITGVEIGAIPLDDLDEYPGDKIMIKTQSVCLYGENLANTLPSLKPGKDITQHIKGIQQEIERTKEWLKKEQSEEEITQRCTWIMKRILRSGFELVMEDLHKYTRDLYYCYLGFSEVYPEKKKEMYQVLELAINPTSNSEIILDILESTGEWLIKETDIKA